MGLGVGRHNLRTFGTTVYGLTHPSTTYTEGDSNYDHVELTIEVLTLVVILTVFSGPKNGVDILPSS